MASETRVIPDLCFPDEDQELQTSSVKGQGGRGQGGGLPGRKTVDLTPEGFIPIHKLTLEDLPEPIRTQEVLQYILDASTQVVRVNNNGISDLRPDEDEFKIAKLKSLTASGVMLERSDQILTMSHVLFNEEELRKSTIDVLYDYHHGDKDDERKLFKRCLRKDGKHFSGMFLKEDIAVASYRVKDKMENHIRDHCVGKYEMRELNCKLTKLFARVRNKPDIVCLISHPLGQPKHVSFGEMVHYDMHSRTVYHTAPSKPGSSGGRVIVFSESLLPQIIVHVGTDLFNGKKYKYARIHYSSMSFSFVAFFDSFKALLGERDYTCREPEIHFEELSRRASASVEIAPLAAFVPIFGAFLLHLAETRPEELDANVLTPCKAFPTDEPLTSYHLKQSVKKVILKVAQVVSSITPFPSSNLDDTSYLDSLLGSQGPCYCQSIVKMMERGVKLNDGTVTECFLSPYAAATKMSSDFDGTWPWLKGRNSDLDKHDAMDGCLLRKCLKLADGDIVPVMLLLMISRANIDIKHLHLPSSDSSFAMMHRDNENQEKTVYKKSKLEPRLEHTAQERHSKTQLSPSLAKEKMNSAAAEVERDWHGLTFDVLTVIYSVLELMSPRFAMRLRRKPQNVLSEHEENEHISKLYSRCLAVSEHSWQHEWQIHPDNVHSGQDDRHAYWCQCGRPGARDVYLASRSLHVIVSGVVGMDDQTLAKKEHDLQNILQEQQNKGSVPDFNNLIELLEQKASDKSLPQATTVLTTLDMTDSFPHGRHSFMLYLASWEAILYNVCLTARQISKHFQPLHSAFPVSVYGRPGNWPGNVTPPEVQRTAWRLIQDAIMASGFHPVVLADLEKDAERREKLIDLYVDMKQLKWQGRIQPHLFGRYLADLRKCMLDHLQRAVPFVNPTHYFEWYATFLVCPKILTS